MNKIQQTIIFSGEGCGSSEDITNKQPSLNADTKPLEIISKYEDLTSVNVQAATCDSNIAFASFETDYEGFSFSECELCKNACIKTLSLSGTDEYPQTLSKNVTISATLAKPVSSDCFIKVKLEGSNLDSSQIEDTLYTYLKATSGEKFLGLRTVNLSNGTWKATANYNEETSDSA